MARVRLVNWSGHGNLGDDAMAKMLIGFLVSKGHLIVEKDYDWTILGGGTMLMHQGEFLGKVDHPARTIGWGIGAAESWTNQDLDTLRQMPAIWCRDDFTYEQLKNYACQAILSFDPLCAHPGPPATVRSGLAVNLLKPISSNKLEYQASANRLAKRFSETPCKWFALGNPEDVAYNDDAVVFSDFGDLVNWLGSFKEAAVSRLHANVAAYVARVPYTVPLAYDQKVSAFWMRVAGIPPAEARQKVLDHLEDLNDVLTSV